MRTKVISNPFPGKFIVFEGIDGCGKSEQFKKTTAWLSALKLPIFTTKEPNKDSYWGSRIYSELSNPNGLHKKDPFKFQEWYAADSKDNLQKFIIPNLRNGRNVLSDRFRMSMCYGARKKSEIPTIMGINQSIIGKDFIWPDLILFFAVNVDTAIDRFKKRDRKADAFEKRDTLLRVANNYREFARLFPQNFSVVDGNGEIEEVFGIVQKHIKELLNLP